MVMKEKRFKVGDMVTYKSMVECVSKDGKPNTYHYDGYEQGGYRGNVINYGGYNEEMECWTIVVSTNNGTDYIMLEKEFEEYEQIKQRFRMDPVKFV
jgi:hypothetical protein